MLPLEGERKQRLLNNEAFVRAVALIKGEENATGRDHLVKTGVRITSSNSPRLSALVETVRSVLEVPIGVEVYITPGSKVYGNYVETFDDTIVVALSSAAVERLKDAELRFVLGHEVGHYLLGHGEIPVNSLLNNSGSSLLSPHQVMELYSWRRCGEISADRLGMIAAGDLKSAISVVVKLWSGLTEADLILTNEANEEQLTAFNKLTSERPSTPDDWYLSHPYHPVRLQALQLLSGLDEESEPPYGLPLLCKYLQHHSNVNSEITDWLLRQDPEALKEGVSVKFQQELFLLYALILVASTGHSEIELPTQSFRDIISPEILVQGARDLKSTVGVDLDQEHVKLNGDQLKNAMSPLFRPLLMDLTLRLNHVEREKLIGTLVEGTQQLGPLDPQKRDMLQFLAMQLNVPMAAESSFKLSRN